jgi:hypothetical protein
MSISEAYDYQGVFGAAFRQGLDTLSETQEITFTLYIQVVLPIDGYVFWVRSDQISPIALLNTYRFGPTGNPPTTLTVKGSFHYATEVAQEQTHTFSINSVVFTAEQEVQEFNAINPQTMWIATFTGDQFGLTDSVRFAFAGRKSLYRQTGIFHYYGQALYSDMTPLIVDNALGFKLSQTIVSNSLPIWLSFNQYARPVPWALPLPPGLTFYPSHVVPDNAVPPFVSVHVYPESTQAIESAPVIGPTATHAQLAEERVRLAMFGLDNDQAQSLMDFIFQYSYDYDVLGIMNMPIIRDEKRTQRELLILSKYKSAEFRVNYNQQSVRYVVRQLIESVFDTVEPTNIVVHG